MDVLSRYRPLVEEFDAFRAACERPLPTAVRVNTLKAPVERVLAAFSEAGVDAEQADWNDRVLRLDTDAPGNTWPYVLGWVNGQEEVSSLPATVLDPQPGETVWDACAAPGSKATQLADLMADRGTLVANDSNLGRLSALRSNAERLGVTNVAVTSEDARNYSLSRFDFDAFDRALVDAPCSCEGTVRKNPDALDDWDREHVDAVSGVQKGILRRAVQATRPGGVVVYATCTFAPEENEAVLDHVLDVEDCAVVPLETGLATRPGVTEWDGDEYDPEVERARRVYPHLNDTGGFFCAKLEVGG
jgi:NOL1/NOP2/sun family putative RNA methylase